MNSEPTNWLIVLRTGDYVPVSKSMVDKINAHINGPSGDKLMAISPQKMLNLVDISEVLGPVEAEDFLSRKGLTKCRFGRLHKAAESCDCEQVARLTDVHGLFGAEETPTPVELESREAIHAQFTDEQRKSNQGKLWDLKNEIRRKHGWPEKIYANG